MAHVARDPHAHGHSHSHDRTRLAIALVVSLATAAIEIAGGLITGSVALLADAVHVVTDASALSLALLATTMARRPHTPRLTFGWHRAEVLVALANALLLFAAAGLVAWHAVERLMDPADVHAGGMLGFAVVGLAMNGVALWLLHGPASINVRAARLHVLGDLGGSVVAVTAGVVIALTGWMAADPLLSLVIVALVVAGGVRLAWDTAGILMQRVPPGVDLAAIDAALRAVPGLLAVHDLHVWSVTTGFEVLQAHVEVAPDADPIATVEACVDLLHDRFGLIHVAIQPERPRTRRLVRFGG
jgi:cobalt-zinc-cadmium efflux system protein